MEKLNDPLVTEHVGGPESEDKIRQALRGGHVDELSISIAPVVLGDGKRLFDGFEETVNLEHARLLQSPSRPTSPTA